MELVHEGVLPPDHVAGRPPVLHEGLVPVGHEHGAEARAAGVDLQLVDPLELEAQRPARPVDLEGQRVLAPEAEARRLERPDRAALELDERLEGIVDGDLAAGALGDERPRQRADRRDLADEVPAEVDDVRAEVAERSGARLVLLEARASNEPALALYRSAGFFVTDVRRAYYSDNGEDAVVMRLELLSPPAERES